MAERWEMGVYAVTGLSACRRIIRQLCCVHYLYTLKHEHCVLSVASLVKRGAAVVGIGTRSRLQLGQVSPGFRNALLGALFIRSAKSA